VSIDATPEQRRANARQSKRNLSLARRMIGMRRQATYERVRKALGKRPGVMRNRPCPCGSGKKYKRCCGRAE